MTQALQNSTGSIGTVSNITKYATEIEQLLAGNTPLKLIATDETVEDPSVFALEKHLEDFLVQNWSHTILSPKYYIFEDEEELAENNQTVRGVIIALEDDLRLRRALKAAPNIDFYRCQVSFKLYKG
jgi:restriction system protein